MTTSRARSWVAPLGALLLAACPPLETPLATVSGRIVGATVGAYAYPLGRPDLKVAAAPDGSFRIEGVPTSVTSLVLFDGTDCAEQVPVELAGGESNRIADRYGCASTASEPKMPPAARVVVAAIPEGGAVPWPASWSVVGTDLSGISQGIGESSVTLAPLPGGSFDLRVVRPGFHPRQAPVIALAGATVALALSLDVDADAPEPGCGAGMECVNGLACNASDGLCYACLPSAGCAAGEECTSYGLCRPVSGPATAFCAGCGADADCASGACVQGYCSAGCASASDCPAGFACGADARCAAPDGCADWLRTLGAPCASDADCVDLAGGRCEHAANATGYCTAACTATAQCQVGSVAMTCPAGSCAP